MEINPRSKLLDVLTAFPELEETIIAVAPPFKNLRNPILRRTVGQLATLEKVAQIGQVDVLTFVNTLRRAAGQPEIRPGAAGGLPVAVVPQPDDPAWLAGEPAATLDGDALLNRGEIPVTAVNDQLAGLPADRYVLLITTFPPLPIIEAMEKQRRDLHHRVQGQHHLTFVRGK